MNWWYLAVAVPFAFFMLGGFGYFSTQNYLDLAQFSGNTSCDFALVEWEKACVVFKGQFNASDMTCTNYQSVRPRVYHISCDDRLKLINVTSKGVLF